MIVRYINVHLLLLLLLSIDHQSVVNHSFVVDRSINLSIHSFIDWQLSCVVVTVTLGSWWVCCLLVKRTTLSNNCWAGYIKPRLTCRRLSLCLEIWTQCHGSLMSTRSTPCQPRHSVVHLCLSYHFYAATFAFNIALALLLGATEDIQPVKYCYHDSMVTAHCLHVNKTHSSVPWRCC